VVVVALIAGYVFGYYLPNQPANVYASSLKNSSKAITKLTNYLQDQTKTKNNSASLDSSIKVKSQQASFDATLTGKFDKTGSGEAKITADVAGQTLSADVRSVKSGSNTPDIYVRASGIKTLLDSQGLQSLDNLDGQWLAIDHTITDTYLAQIKQSSTSTSASLNKSPTADQVNDAISKVNAVNQKYLFSTDKQTAVLTNNKFVGKETKDGRTVDHFVVGYNKDHLKAYINAMKATLDSSSLNDWSKKANDGKNLSDVLDFTSLQASVNKADSNFTFDLWADVKTKLVHAISLKDKKDSSTTTISQNYTGGGVYPFTIRADGKVDGQDGSVVLNMTVDTNTHKYSLDGSYKEGTTEASFKLAITPSSSSVSEQAPAGAKPIMEVLQQLGGGL
jgi:hypothetical protein